LTSARMRRPRARGPSALLWGVACLGLAASAARASLYPLPTDGSSVIGADTNVTTVYEDTLPDLAHRYSLGYYEIIRANPGLDVWIPGAGKQVTLPGRHILPAGPREGIVVNLPEHRLYYFPRPQGHEHPIVITYPVSIGKMDWHTPLGETHVIAKIVHRRGIRPSRSARSTRRMTTRCRSSCLPDPTTRWAITRCDWGRGAAST